MKTVEDIEAGTHTADLLWLTRDEFTTLQITVGKLLLGYKPGDELWAKEDDIALAMLNIEGSYYANL